ncbi:AAA family ATPase [Halobacillus shinanisalinarum]|uniref:AAA family ATPase n=1 Tax=Halobacillus shinanisalinarum TaxID=2932258 RepID=A0ABY4GZM6_9BACI|nr:AAA family ATPase [Halobacillus shinanisalinarum]UOQ93375.1 AAA family ATPase [Halobacillus shinanisalinarum]
MYPQAKAARPGTINIVLNEAKGKADAVNSPSAKGKHMAPFRKIDQYFNPIIGMQELKVRVKEIYAQVLIAQKRKDLGLKSNGQVLHMIFKGNPGTGKTTIARMVATLFQEMEVLEKGHFIEADRSDLVGEYIGHTAQKTKDLIKKAIGGVLFIDEAYSLARGGDKDFGKEAIDTIVKCMEDHHDELVIILAGYPYEMEDFLNINPGLASRFPIQLEFDDYSAIELSAIADVMVQDRDYALSPQASKKLYEHLVAVCYQSQHNFSNARYVRNVIEEAIRKHAYRVAGSSDHARATLITLEAEDFQQINEKTNYH